MARDRLNPARVVEAARGIARDEGLDAVSMRRLAEELDVWPMSVYRHFRDKDELLVAIVAAAVGDVDDPDPSLPWRDRLATLTRGIRAALEPGDLAPRLGQAALAPEVLAVSDTGIAILMEAGFGPDEAARAWHLLLGYASSRLPTAEVRSARAALAGLAEDEHPALAAAAEPLARAMSDESEAFDYGLDRLLDGVEQQLTKIGA
jgi:AcrR family transcriptional regulator